MKIEWNRVTWYSKILALALFVALPFAGFYFGIKYGVAKQYIADSFLDLKNASSSVPAAQGTNAYYENVSEWQTDQNNSGWSIAYPIDFNTADNYSPAPTDNWREGTPGGPGLQPFTLTIPRAFEPQTNFAEATLTVGLSGNAAAVAQCLAMEPMGPPDQLPTSTVTLGGTVFTVFHLSDAGAGNYYETTSYRTVHAGKCWAVEYTIHSSQIGNYPAEYGLQPFDEAKLHDVLDRIAGTFKFK
ncbi:MAG: hypothetical protein WCF77_04675 [Minisyncoccia bacterium]|jgi:hypothetical protein